MEVLVSGDSFLWEKSSSSDTEIMMVANIRLFAQASRAMTSLVEVSDLLRRFEPSQRMFTNAETCRIRKCWSRECHFSTDGQRWIYPIYRGGVSFVERMSRVSYHVSLLRILYWITGEQALPPESKRRLRKTLLCQYGTVYRLLMRYMGSIR